MADLIEEKKLWRKGYKFVAGIDEVGRGPLAGPVVAGAVIITTARLRKFPKRNSGRPWGEAERSEGVAMKRRELSQALIGIKDSKKLSPRRREELYKILITHPQIEWAVGRVYPKVIDRINILEATKLAMERAVNRIQNTKVKSQNYNSKFKIDYLILDGKMKLDIPILQKSIIKADEKVFSCAAASIIAKVKRDKIMERYHKKYPQYGFDKHKGYPTKYHKKMLKKHGLCEIHRQSFRPAHLLS